MVEYSPNLEDSGKEQARAEGLFGWSYDCSWIFFHFVADVFLFVFTF